MENLVGGGNAILLLLTAMAVGGALLIAFLASRRDQRRVAGTFVAGAAIVAALYSGGLIAASAASSEQVIPRGNTKWFCGFYLDCHLGMSVERTEKTPSLQANGSAPIKAKGLFNVITIRLHNSARNPNIDMLLYCPEAKIVDALGNEYHRSQAAEATLTQSGQAGSLGAETKVTHDPVDASLVFDLPANVQNPRLVVTEGWIVDKVIEFGLIADENSIFHKKSSFSLEDAKGRTASTSSPNY